MSKIRIDFSRHIVGKLKQIRSFGLLAIESEEINGEIDLEIFQDESGKTFAFVRAVTIESLNIFIFGDVQVVDEGSEPPVDGYLSLSDGKKRFDIRWLECVQALPGNPVTLVYSRTEGDEYKLSLDNIEAGSLANIDEIRAYRADFAGLIKFEQAQRGGRKPGSRDEETKKRYIRILRHRNSPDWRLRSDREFLEEYDYKYNRSLLSRAKKWDAEGRP